MKRRIALLFGYFLLAAAVTAQEESVFRIYGWPVFAIDVSQDEKGYHLRNAKMVLDNHWPDENNLVFQVIDLSPSGDLLFCSPSLGGDEFGLMYPVLVRPDGFMFRRDGPFGGGLYVTGELIIENSDGEANPFSSVATRLTFPDYTILVGSQIEFDSKYSTSGGPAYSSFGGWKLKASRIASGSFGPGFPGVILRDVSLQPLVGTTILSFPEVDLTPSGQLIGVEDDLPRLDFTDPLAVSVNGWNAWFYHAALMKDGRLLLSTSPQMPTGFPESGMIWEIAVSSAGLSECLDSLYSDTGEWGPLSIDYRDIEFDLETIQVAKVQISLPPSIADAGLTIYNASLHSDGRITGAFEPLSLTSGDLLTCSAIDLGPSEVRFYAASDNTDGEVLYLSLDTAGRSTIHAQSRE